MSAVLGHRIRASREKAGLTQGALARAVGTPRVNIVYIETGRTVSPRVVLAVRIADVLGVSLDYLTGRTDHKRVCSA